MSDIAGYRRRQPLLPAILARISAALPRLKRSAPASPATDIPRQGIVSLVGAGPGAPDLITLRGLDRLRRAEVILFDRLVDPALLNEAPAEAERIFVGKMPGGLSWKQDEINALLCHRAAAGYRVVRLKCGDPGIFGRGAEELEAVARIGVPCEIVPGVTAAFAAAADAGMSLTRRGAADTLVISTGQMREGAEDPDWARHLRPGVTLALYMGVGRAPVIQAALLRHGCEPETRVTIVESASHAASRIVTCALADLPETIRAEGVKNPATMIFCPQMGALGGQPLVTGMAEHA